MQRWCASRSMVKIVMKKFEEGIKLINECCGYGKDNVISLSTIANTLSHSG